MATMMDNNNNSNINSGAANGGVCVITCQTARDLMPLCADGTAGGETKALLAAHLTGCAECSDYYNRLTSRAYKRELPKRAGRLSTGGFGPVAERIKRRRAAYISAAAAVIAVLAG